MLPHEERVVYELFALSEKVHRLATFINGEAFKKLPVFDGELLRTQLFHMHRYKSTLEARMVRFQK
jgi:hypothetical protein